MMNPCCKVMVSPQKPTFISGSTRETPSWSKRQKLIVISKSGARSGTYYVSTSGSRTGFWSRSWSESRSNSNDTPPDQVEFWNDFWERKRK